MVSANQTATIVTITSPGPQGPQGPIGPPGGATTGSNTFTGDQTITGSILISGSIIPAVGVGETTSSFSLGSDTAAWKDIWVSNGSIKFITSGSPTVTLSSTNGGIQVNGGSVISANGVSGQFLTSKSLSDNVTVTNSNNSLLMGPIDIESGKEIVVEEGSDLTVFGDIEIQSVSKADVASFATSASYSSTASYALNVSCSCTPFPYSGSAVVTGSLIINDGTYDIIDTNLSILYDPSGIQSIGWGGRTLCAEDGTTAVSYGTPGTLEFKGDLFPSVSTPNVSLGSETQPWAKLYLSSSIVVHTQSAAPTWTGIEGEIVPGKNGSNYYLYTYIGGRWRSASLA